MKGKRRKIVSNTSLHYSIDFLNLFQLTHFCNEDKAGEANALFFAAWVFIEHPVPPSV